MSHTFDTIYKEHRPYVVRLSRKLARGDRDLADDLSQEAWLALLAVPDTRSAEARYIRTVLTRAMYRWLRRERAQQVVTLEFRPRQTKPPRHDVLKFRRNIPRPHIQAIVPALPRRRRTAA